MKATFSEIDHSGDVGIEARGADMAELLAHLTQGLFALMHRGDVQPAVRRAVRVTSASSSDLVVDWLNEVITTAGACGELYGEVLVERADDVSAEGVLRGERVDPERHDVRFDVKAATYHGLSVSGETGAMCARVIFDL